MVAPISEVTYHLDPVDRIAAVNDAWQVFADRNDGAALRAPAIIGQRLWDHLTDPTTVELYRLALLRVRRHAATVRFEFRCDSPSRRRLLAMEIAPERAGMVRFSTRTIREEARDPVELLDATVRHDAPPITMCSWCKRVDLGGGEWGEVEAALASLRLFDRDVPPLISHGMCPACHDMISGLLDADDPGKRPA